MTTVRLSDVIIPVLWTPAFILADPVLTRFFQSGIAQVNPLMDEYAHSPAGAIVIPWLKPLDGTIPENQSSDDPTALSTPQGTGTGQLAATKIFRNQSWSSMDLVAALFNPDPLTAIRSQVAGYWAHRWQAYCLSVLQGVTASNVANDAGDMVFDATGATGNAPNGSSLANMSLTNILSAKQTMGDSADKLAVIAMHSVVMTNLQQQQLITFIPDGQNNGIMLPYYGSYRVVVDDGMPVTGTAPNFVYTSYIFQPGFIQWGSGIPKTPTETFRTPNAGNGEGQETFYNRQHWVGHPLGMNYTLNVAGVPVVNPTNTQLSTAPAYARSWARKQVPFVAVKTKG
jgi:hypothetical protein